MEHVDRLPPFSIAAGLIRDQSETHAREWFEVVALEHVDAGQHFRRAGAFITRSKLFLAPGDFVVIIGGLIARAIDHRSVSHRTCDNRRHATAQWSNITFTVRMDAIAQKDHKHLARRIEPKRRAGETGVTKRTERKQIATIRGETGVDIPAESTRGTGAGNDMRARHLGDR